MVISMQAWSAFKMGYRLGYHNGTITTPDDLYTTIISASEGPGGGIRQAALIIESLLAEALASYLSKLTVIGPPRYVILIRGETTVSADCGQIRLDQLYYRPVLLELTCIIDIDLRGGVINADSHSSMTGSGCYSDTTKGLNKTTYYTIYGIMEIIKLSAQVADRMREFLDMDKQYIRVLK
ncbi:hypothetical protein J6590_000089 [Homalodisca vitripennis]|nr:hypothetical protein J6590_000089 [Homalodisca vitripennis]